MPASAPCTTRRRSAASSHWWSSRSRSSGSGSPSLCNLPHADARWTDLIPGSLFYAIGFVSVEIFSVLILGQMIKEKSTTYGALGIAGAILLDLFLIGRVIVGAAVVNATLYERSSRARPQQA